MLEQPDAGDIIKGSGGIRKLRWKEEYAKNELEDLTTNEIKLLKRIVEEWDNA